MERVAIVADSIACLTKDMVEQYRIRIVPASILFNGKVYREYLDIDQPKAYSLLEKDPEHFSTSAASPADYLQAYRELTSQAQAILCITISSKLSMFYSAASVAKDQSREELPQTAIEVLDSRTAAAAEGLVVLAAARAAAEGKSLPEVIEAAEAVKEKVALFGVMETTRYVYRSGRMPKVAAQIGSTLSLKPIFTLSDGEAHFVGIARSKQRGVDRILHMMRQKVEDKPVHVAVMHADALEEAEKVKEQVSSGFNCVELWVSEFSPVMGYATGRGLVGLAYYADD